MLFRVFCLVEAVLSRNLRFVPVLIAAAVILIGCVLEYTYPYSQRNQAEFITYDWRIQLAQKRHGTSYQIATNLGFIAINDQTIELISDGSLGYQYGLYWPRHIYGSALRELSAEGAKAVAFDVIFANLRKDHDMVELPDKTKIGSDEYFAQAITNAGNAILAATPGLMPEPLFYTNAYNVGDIAARRDPGGVLRRERPFFDAHIWHPLILKLVAAYNLDLTRIRETNNQLSFYCERDQTWTTLPLDSEGRVKSADLKLDPIPDGAAEAFIPYKIRRIWGLGIELAARELALDLDHAQITKNSITLSGTNGLTRVIPLDDQGMFQIDWRIRLSDPKLSVGVLEDLLLADKNRAQGFQVENEWSNQLVIIGSVATGNDLTDLGATPLDAQTFLVSKHWNVANAVICDQFITLCPRWMVFTLIVALGALSGWMTWNLRPTTGFIALLLLMTLYVGLAFWLFIEYRYWLPLMLPCFEAAAATYAMIVTYRVLIESLERKRVRSIFSKMVAPTVVNELLKLEKLGMSISRRRDITVLFSDVRGFTQLTDATQTRAEEYIERNHLSGKEAEDYRDKTAAEILDTVNCCLAIISEAIGRYNGVLDKYIGDCVMAFWGAPVDDPQHALHCVRCAIDAQAALHALNEQRVEENKRIEEENRSLVAEGKFPKPLLPLISLGTGVNSGQSIVGLMGSDAYGFNYTVFGREINLASRLEGVSGHGRIVIGENTYKHLQRDDPALAALCAPLELVKVKGFSREVQAYEVPWRKIISQGTSNPASDLPKTDAKSNR